MAKYLVLLYENEQGYAEAGEQVLNQVMAGHQEFSAKYGPAIDGGNALQPTSTATTVRSDGANGFTVTDGPFVETKEALGGYYLIEAADLDEVVEMAKAVPTPFGGIEIRPIMVFS